MACFSLAWLEQILIWAVIVAAVFAILKLIVPYILGMLGVAGGIIAQAINIVLWAVIAIFVIYIVFGLLSCLLGGGFLPPLPHR